MDPFVFHALICEGFVLESIGFDKKFVVVFVGKNVSWSHGSVHMDLKLISVDYVHFFL